MALLVATDSAPQWTPAIVERDRWEDAFLAFLGSKSEHTRRSYASALTAFFSAVGKTPDRVLRADVVAWRLQLEARGAAPKTVAARLTALSSFYAYLCSPDDAMGSALCVSNPVTRGDRPATPAYANSRKMRRADFEAILGTTEGGSPVDLRDRALLLCYVYTGRRRVEIARLTGRNLEEGVDGAIFYRYTGKGGKAGFRELDPPAADSLRAYLERDGRTIASLRDDEPVFRSERGRTAGAAITPDGILRTMKARAKRAGVDPRRVQIHGIRHLSAETYRETGAPLEEVRDFLDHSSLEITQRYLKQIKGVRNTRWAAMRDILQGPK